ncbi:LysE family translocator [Vibrio tapetis subsp. quintayensis]|uniref:LysE family translocator n=1 Tax=Vibrio tapetis TaxID=52443 RepID=UPI0025B327E7|nr:LysE family translocator [Vibrio tapetis]MDN3678890.1 LysE family translocator [Vibrio tapetis subsp. quintayensis]
MNEFAILATLASVHFIALMSPGPDVALVVQNASRHGRSTGIAIAAGLSVGILLHSLLSLTGVSYIVHQHPTLFAALQLIGGSYLLYLGIGALRSLRQQRNNPLEQPQKLLKNKRQAFLRGFTTNILNPKAVVFFVSLMSSLVPAGMSLTGKFFALLILFSLSFAWFSALAWLLSTARLQKKMMQAAIYIDGLCGVVFCLIGGGILASVFTS